MASILWPIGQRVTHPTTGAPLFGAKLYTFASGTLNAATTYSDKNLTIPNSNPLVSNAAGLWEVGSARVDVWGEGSFKFVIEDASGNPLYTFDPVEDNSAVTSLGPKASVRAATTGNIVLSGLQTIDGVSIAADDRVLVKNQTTASENGPYLAKSGAWTRATDMDEDAEATGFSVKVREGTVNGKKDFGLTTDGEPTLGTTSLTIEEFSDPTSAIDTAKKSTRGRRSVSANTNIVANDAGGTVELTGSTGRNFTIDPADFSDNEYGFFEQQGTGQITVVAGGSGVLRFNSAFTALSRGQWSTVTWEKISSTEIKLGGDLDPV